MHKIIKEDCIFIKHQTSQPHTVDNRRWLNCEWSVQKQESGGKLTGHPRSLMPVCWSRSW